MAPAPAPDSKKISGPEVYYNDAGVTAPELIPAAPISPVPNCKKVEGLPVIGVIVDQNGWPHNIAILRTGGAKIDRLATGYVADRHFQPAVLNGRSVPVAIELELEIEGCKQNVVGADGKKTKEVVLGAEPVATLEVMPRPIPDPNAPPQMIARELSAKSTIAGMEEIQRGAVTAPRPINTVQAQMSPSARKFKIQGTCLIEMVVDANGEPKNIRLIRSIDPGLDKQALDVVAQYRFKPATRKGLPVPVLITVEVNFHLF